MTEEQKRLVRARVDAAERTVYTLGEFAGDGGDIRDPVGQDEARYRATRDEIKRRLESSLEAAAAAARLIGRRAFVAGLAGGLVARPTPARAAVRASASSPTTRR